MVLADSAPQTIGTLTITSGLAPVLKADEFLLTVGGVRVGSAGDSVESKFDVTGYVCQVSCLVHVGEYGSYSLLGKKFTTYQGIQARSRPRVQHSDHVNTMYLNNSGLFDRLLHCCHN